MQIKNILNQILKIGIISAALASTSQSVLASGLTIPFGPGVVELGDGRSSRAAIAEDASTNFNNPAGLIRIQNQQMIVSAVAVSARQKFSGTMSNPGILALQGPPFSSFAVPVTASGASSTTTKGVIPNFHYVYPLCDKWAFGISILVPYGLGLNYRITSLPRYEVTHALQAGYEISPSLAYAINDKFSIGLGPDMLYYSAKAKTAIRTQSLTLGDSTNTNEASSYNNFGWHIGALYQFTPQTRVGLSYRSAIVTHLNGTSRFYVTNSNLPSLVPNGMLTSHNFKLTIPLASITTLSAYHEITPCWAVMGSVEYEGWGIYKADHGYNIATAIPGVTQNAQIPANYRDTWFFALGSSYQLTDQWLVRGGVDYNTGMTTNAHREIMILDPTTFGVCLGARYKYSKKLHFDFATTQGFFKTVRINHKSPITGNRLVGKGRQMSIPTLGAQLTWNIT